MNKIRKLQAFNFPDQFIRHQNNEGELTTFDPAKADDFFFELIEDPAQNTVRFKSVNFPTKFLRHKNFRILLEAPAPGEETLFANDSTFTVEDGQVGNLDNFHSYRSVNFPDRWLRHIDFHAFIDVVADDQAKSDASFLLVSDPSRHPDTP